VGGAAAHSSFPSRGRGGAQAEKHALRRSCGTGPG
jgi:hypothetical protein